MTTADSPKHHLAVLFHAWEREQADAYDAQEADRDWFADRPFDLAENEFRNFIGEGVN